MDLDQGGRQLAGLILDAAGLGQHDQVADLARPEHAQPSLAAVIARICGPHLGDQKDRRNRCRSAGSMGVHMSDAAREEAALEVCARTKLFTLAESLGGVESLIEHPGKMTHASTAGSMLEVPADLVRVSVGIESGDDLVADLLEALG